MIVQNHEIAYQNVVSKYYQFAPEDIDTAMEDFHYMLEEQGYEIQGHFFYSLLSDPTDENLMIAEIFLPIEESHFIHNDEEAMFFRSYFNIKSMVMTRIMDDFEEKTQAGYWDVVRYIEQQGFEQATPVFFEFKTSHTGKHYIEISSGVKERMGEI